MGEVEVNVYRARLHGVMVVVVNPWRRWRFTGQGYTG